MQMKKVIINADDFGYSKEINEAIKQASEAGIMTSASLMANMKAFDNAVYEIYPKIEYIDIGFHFNLTEGESLSGLKLLCNNKGLFNNGFISLLSKANNKKVLQAIEQEFRMQIEKVLKVVNISHIDSHRHVHAIPQIFNLVCNLAKEYNIRYIRTQKEIPYIVPSKIINIKFPANIAKNILLNYFSSINQYPYTNNFFIGVLYTGYMDKKSILKGLEEINIENSITEIILHPTTNMIHKNNHTEFQTLKDSGLKQIIKELGFDLTQYSKL